MRLFLDNNLAVRHARALSALLAPDHEVVHLRDKFDPGVDDAHWLEVLGKEGEWIVLSGDTRIRTVPQLREVLRRANLTVVFLKPGWMKLKLLEQHSRLAASIETILQTVGESRPGTSFSLGVRGKLERLGQ